MKKFLIFFAAALISLCSYADESCPSALNLALLNGDDPSQVEVEIQLFNTSSNLFGFSLIFEKDPNCENIQWKKIGQHWLYFDFESYFDVILANLEIPAGQDINDPDFFFSHLDIKAYPTNNIMQIKEELWVPSNFFYPVLEEPTGVGKFALDMSSCEDGDYQLYVAKDPNDYNGSLYYKYPDGRHSWQIDEPMVLTLTKQGNIVVEKQRRNATYVPSSFTSISTINTDDKVDGRIFDLQGRELQSAPEHGIYIQNGKKYIK